MNINNDGRSVQVTMISTFGTGVAKEGEKF